MTFDFFVNQTQYTVNEHYVSMNGQIVAEGQVFVIHLLFGRPALIILDGDTSQPKILKTGIVTSVLPKHECFEGINKPPKSLYNIYYCPGRRKSLQFFECLAFNQEHALELLQLRGKCEA